VNDKTNVVALTNKTQIFHANDVRKWSEAGYLITITGRTGGGKSLLCGKAFPDALRIEMPTDDINSLRSEADRSNSDVVVIDGVDFFSTKPILALADYLKSSKKRIVLLSTSRKNNKSDVFKELYSKLLNAQVPLKHIDIDSYDGVTGRGVVITKEEKSTEASVLAFSS
jgi:energy-coupling factor transporter ATP-binding protein EcfA2